MCESTPTHGVMTAASSSPVTTAITPGILLGAPGVDRNDLRMGMRRAHEHHMRHPRQLHVADIETAPLQQPIEIGPRHRLADVGVRPVQFRQGLRRIAACSVMARGPCCGSCALWRSLPPHRRSPDSRCSGSNCRRDARGSVPGPGSASLLQQVLRCYQHARRAVAALQRVAFAKRGLQIGDLAAIRQILRWSQPRPRSPAPRASGRNERSRH